MNKVDYKSCPHLLYKPVERRTQTVNYLSRICNTLGRGVRVRGDITIFNGRIREGLTCRSPPAEIEQHLKEGREGGGASEK